MAYNGEGPHNKRQRTDIDSGNHRNHDVAGGGGGGGSDEPRRKRQEEAKPNHILLFTIINPMYPITVEVLHTICQPSGQVLRIVIFKKNGVQAMVEFDNVDSATRAKESLNGADIYSGCCTLKIDFAKPEKLNVHKNDAESWDYTIVNKDSHTNGRPQPLLQDPHFSSRPQPYNPSANFGNEHVYDEYNSGYNAGDPYSSQGGGAHHPGHHGGPPLLKDGGAIGGGGGAIGGLPYRGGGAIPPGANMAPGGPMSAGDRNAPMAYPGAGAGVLGRPQQGSVMMVYGLDPQKANTDKLFNLVCLYGNVARIKYLKTKEGTAMVQMGDNIAVERCVQNLNNVTVAGDPEQHLQLAFSKQAFLGEVTNPYPLPDKTPSFKEYTANKNNRFMNPAMASKNRIQPPSKILHFFNTPPNVSESTLLQVFREYGVAPPSAVRMFPMRSERSSSGLLEFNTVSEAVAAVMSCNHAAIESQGTKFPFIMKLCFSSTRSMSVRNSNNNSNNSFDNSNNSSTNNGQSASLSKMDQDS